MTIIIIENVICKQLSYLALIISQMYKQNAINVQGYYKRHRQLHLPVKQKLLEIAT